MNRAPTLVRPAANERQRPAKDGQPYPRQEQLCRDAVPTLPTERRGQHVVLSLPRDSGRVADASLPCFAACHQLTRKPLVKPQPE
jgi:hypothetical protein